MKTFLMIYNENTKELIDEYEETNDPQTTFNNWYLESDVSFEVFQNSIAFYFIGSVNIEERKSGFIRYDAIKSKLVVKKSILYLTFSDEGLNVIYHRHQNIIWDDKSNNYLLAPDGVEEMDEDELYDFTLPLDILMPNLDAFLEVKRKYHLFVTQNGRNFRRLDTKPLKYKSFYKKCKVCGNITVLKIDDMLEGKKVNCVKCNVSVKTKITI